MVELEIEEYLKADHVKIGDIAEIINEGEVRSTEETGFDKPTFDIKVKVNNIEYIWSMNKTTQRNLAAKYGKDTKGWVGKKILLKKIERDVFGKIKEVIYGYPKEEPKKETETK